MLLVLLFVYFARVKFLLFLFLFVSGVGFDLCLWYSLDFSINFLHTAAFEFETFEIIIHDFRTIWKMRKAKRPALSQQTSTRPSKTKSINHQRLTGSGHTITIRINNNRSIALERSVNITGGLNRFHARATPALGSALVHKHTLKVVQSG